MSYKYTNVREYKGGLVFEDAKNQKNVVVNSGGVEIYGKENSITQHTTFNANGFTDNQKVNESFYDLKRGIKLYNADSTGYVTFSTTGVVYGVPHGLPQNACFRIDFANQTVMRFYSTADDSTTQAGLSSSLITLGYSSRTAQKTITMTSQEGLAFADERNGGINLFKTDGLYLKDGSGNTCYLKFEGGKLKINGKEIATLENS